MNSSPVGRKMQNIGAGIYNQSIGRLYDMETGLFRGLGNVASIPGEAIGGVGDFLREGYQYIDRNLFGDALPGGSIGGDIRNFDADQRAGVEEANSWQNPFKGLTDLISGTADSFRSNPQKMYEDYFSQTERALVDRFMDKGFSKKEAVNIILNEGSAYSDAGRLFERYTISIIRCPWLY